MPKDAGGHGSDGKLTPELADKLVETVRDSRLFDNQVAVMCGISPTTLRNWLRWGLHGNGREPYVSFAERYTKAQIGVESGDMKEIVQAEDWRAKAWYWERHRPKRYGDLVPAGGPRDHIDVSELIEQVAQQGDQLLELMRNPPPELQEAMKVCAPEIRAFLDREVPLLAPSGGQ